MDCSSRTPESLSLGRGAALRLRPLFRTAASTLLLATAIAWTWPIHAAGTREADTGSSQAAVDARPRLHPEFAVDQDLFETLVAPLGESDRARALADPFGFVEGIQSLLGAENAYTVLVDKENPLPADYEPGDLIPLAPLEDSGRLVLNPRTRPTLSVRRDTLDALLEMVDEAAADGVELLISSTYRSYEYQEDLFAYWVDVMGLEEAERISARAGTSQHQLGTTIDFGCVCPEFADTAAGQWLARRAWEFGFSLSYPDGHEELTGYSYESWHFRYMTPAVTEFEREYFAGLQQNMLEYFNEFSWVWFLLRSYPADEVPVIPGFNT